MNVSVVVAYGKNREIGVNNQLPWRLSDDLKNFKKHTMGKPVAMGRKTFESIGRPLPGRENIVLTRNKDYPAEGITVMGGLEELFKRCEDKNVEELAIIGGDKIFSQVMDKVNLMYLTEVEASFPAAEAFFPAFNPDDWELVESYSHPQDEKNEYPWTFKILKKKT